MLRHVQFLLASLLTICISGSAIATSTEHPEARHIRRVILLKQGKIVADGEKREVLTGENLYRTYDTKIRVSEVDGYYLASPGGD